MVGLLNAPRGTRLYERLRKENRLLVVSTLVKHPRSLREALTVAVYGLHFRKVVEGGRSVSS